MGRLFIRFYLALAVVVSVCVVTVLVTLPPRHQAIPEDHGAWQIAAEAPTLMVEALIRATDPEKRELALRTLERRLESTITVEPIARVKDQIFPLQLERLERGEPVVAPWDGGAVSLLVAIPDQPLVAVMPLPGPTPVQRTGAFLLVVLILGLAGAVLVILVPLQRQLVTLSNAATRIGGGELGARAEVRDNDAAGKLAGAFNDMAERIEQLIQRREELLRAVSHELRTPIARLEFAVEMLAVSDDLADRERRATEIQGDLQELNGLVSELMSYATLDDDAGSLKREPVDLRPLLEELCEAASLVVPGVAVTLTPGEQVTVNADRRLLRRLITNLLSNGARYTETTVEATVTVDDGLVRVDVDDDGSGVPEEERERIFEPMVRLDSARSRDTGGVGLGLSLARRIAVAHGGSVIVGDSGLGGARFTVRLAQ